MVAERGARQAFAALTFAAERPRLTAQAISGRAVPPSNKAPRGGFRWTEASLSELSSRGSWLPDLAFLVPGHLRAAWGGYSHEGVLTAGAAYRQPLESCDRPCPPPPTRSAGLAFPRDARVKGRCTLYRVTLMFRVFGGFISSSFPLRSSRKQRLTNEFPLFALVITMGNCTFYST